MSVFEICLELLDSGLIDGLLLFCDFLIQNFFEYRFVFCRYLSVVSFPQISQTLLHIRNVIFHEKLELLNRYTSTSPYQRYFTEAIKDRNSWRPRLRVSTKNAWLFPMNFFSGRAGRYIPGHRSFIQFLRVMKSEYLR